MKRMEIRIKDISIDHSEGRKIGGYVNVTERESETLYSQKRGKWFKEVMKKGVFERALKKNQSIPCLLEHNWDKELAHTAKGTLELREDNIGLRFDAIINDDEVYEQIKSGAINSCSFGFTVEEQDFEDVNSRLEKRYVHEINLKEISLVKNPAYIGSLVEQRNLEMALREDEEMNKEKEIVETVEEETTEVVETETTEEERAVKKEDKTVKENSKDEDADETEDVDDADDVDDEKETTKEKLEDKKDKDDKEDVEEDDKRSVETVVETDNSNEEVIKEIVEDAIEKKEVEVAIHEQLAENTEEYAKELEEQAEEMRKQSILHEINSLKCKADLLRLKKVKYNL